MEIRQLNTESILIKGKKEVVLVNPSEDKVKKYENARVVIFTDKKKDFLGLGTEKVVISGPGEYEVGGIEINGLNGSNGDVIYVMNVDGVRVGVLGNLSETLSEKKVSKVNDLDVLVIGVANKEKISHKHIWDWGKKWGTNYVLPFGVEQDSEDMKSFLDVADREDLEKMDSLKVDKDNLPEGTEVVILSISK